MKNLKYYKNHFLIDQCVSIGTIVVLVAGEVLTLNDCGFPFKHQPTIPREIHLPHQPHNHTDSYQYDGVFQNYTAIGTTASADITYPGNSIIRGL